MKDVYIQKEMDGQYTVFWGGMAIGTYFLHKGLILTPVSPVYNLFVTLDGLDVLVEKLHKLESDSKEGIKTFWTN